MPLMLLNPNRPTKEFMRRCLAGIGPGAADPGAVCASTWQKLSAAGKRKWLARENPAGLEARFGLRAIYIKGGRSHEATGPFHGRTFATLPELNRWAQALGFKWIERRSYIFGGYYNKPDGASLLPDIFFPKLARENPRFATLIRGPGGEPEAARHVGRAVKVGRETFYLSRASGDPELPWTVTDPVSGHGVAAGKSAREALGSLKKRIKDYGGPAGFMKAVNEARREIMARLSHPNPGAAWHGHEAGVASEEQEVARLKGQPARGEYFAGMEQAHMESAAESERLSDLAAFKRHPERYYSASPPEKPWTPRRRYNPVKYDLDKLLPEKAAAFAKALKHYYLAGKISPKDYEAIAGRLDRMGQARRELRFLRAAAFLRGQSFHPSAVKWNPGLAWHRQRYDVLMDDFRRFRHTEPDLARYYRGAAEAEEIDVIEEEMRASGESLRQNPRGIPPTGKAPWGSFPLNLLEAIQYAPGKSDYASWGNLDDRIIAKLVEQAHLSARTWPSARLLSNKINALGFKSKYARRFTELWRSLSAADIGEVLNQARRDSGVNPSPVEGARYTAVLVLPGGAPLYHPGLSLEDAKGLVDSRAKGGGGFVTDRQGTIVYRGKANPAVGGARLKRLSGGPEKSYRGFHGAPVDSAREVKVPADWPRKLWMLGRMDEMHVSLDPQREGGLGMKLHGGTVAVGPRNGRLYIIGAMPPLKAGTVGLVKEISYTPPKRSGKAFGGSYVHAFDRPPRLTGRGGRFLEVSGQGLKLTRRGIVG